MPGCSRRRKPRVLGRSQTRRLRSAVETQIVAVWAEVSGVDHIRIHTKRFEVWGHSLAASPGHQPAAVRPQLPVSLCMLFEAPTIAELATLIAPS